ncbi:hypothetical protein N7488_001497 [Penicillium malachiteum]|nr:hypothetical protein N7488_001497 [Penicillium malachiteum]
MPQLQSLGLYGLSFLLANLVSAFPNADSKPVAHAGFQRNIPAPTNAPGLTDSDLSKRDSIDSINIDTTVYATSSSYYPVTTYTSWVPASVCGYVDGMWEDDSIVYCGNGNQCVFHTSDSSYPDMVGCCAGNDPNACAYETTCYDNDDISATPDLTENYDVFGVYCTATGAQACQTWTYPDLGVIGYGCGYTADFETLYLVATLTSTTDATYYDLYPTVAAVSPSIVDDQWIDIYVSGTAATATTAISAPVTPGLATETASQSTTSSLSSVHNGSSKKGSSTNTAAIAGGVVGGVVGAAGIGAAIFMFWLLQKKRKQNSANAITEASQPAFSGSGPTENMPQYPTSIIVPPQEVEGSTYQQYAEVDGYAAAQKFPSSASALSSSDNKPQEMDSKNFVAELPAHQDEQRPLSSDTSRPSSPQRR